MKIDAKLILALSMFGLAMALGTVWFIPSSVEGACWFAIFLVIAAVVARRAPGRYFLHGFLVGLTNWVWVAGAHVLLFDAWAAHHAAEVAGMSGVTVPVVAWFAHHNVPIPGASGVVIGALSWIASRIPVARKKVAA